MSDEHDKTGGPDLTEELPPQVEQANDLLLYLAGDITKLGILLAEIPEDQIRHISDRYTAVLELVDGLPVKISSPHWGANPMGEA